VIRFAASASQCDLIASVHGQPVRCDITTAVGAIACAFAWAGGRALIIDAPSHVWAELPIPDDAADLAPELAH
ncbi:MAG: hypothetical protein ACTH31_14380, partial [Pseudoclavibacter sp.]